MNHSTVRSIFPVQMNTPKNFLMRLSSLTISAIVSGG
jgi:hypothetical protein